MSCVAIEPSNSTARRWFGLVTLVFLSQLLLIFLLSGRPQTRSRIAPSVAPLLLFPEQLTEAEFAEKFLVSNPDLFVSPNVSGFSGTAWLNIPPRDYEKSRSIKRTEPPFWLTLNLQQLGNSISRDTQTNAASAPVFAETVRPKIQFRKKLENVLEPETPSQLRVEGALAARELLNPPQLQAWPHTEILSNSVAQISVDKYGSVLSARLLLRSGFSNADNNALEIARNLQFSPSGESNITLGQLSFEWRTLAVIAANGEPKAIQP